MPTLFDNACMEQIIVDRSVEKFGNPIVPIFLHLTDLFTITDQRRAFLNEVTKYRVQSVKMVRKA